MQVRLLIDHPYHGSAGTIVEINDRTGGNWISNRIAEPLSGPAVEVSNKKLDAAKVRKGTLVNKQSS